MLDTLKRHRARCLLYTRTRFSGIVRVTLAPVLFAFVAFLCQSPQNILFYTQKARHRLRRTGPPSAFCAAKGLLKVGIIQTLVAAWHDAYWTAVLESVCIRLPVLKTWIFHDLVVTDKGR